MTTTSPAKTDHPAEPDAGDGCRAVLIASDDHTRVEKLVRGDRQLLRKSYSFDGLLSLRTMWRRSRAEREFTNLRRLADAGVPCVPVVRWSEQRACGCVRQCEVTTEFVDASDLRSALRRIDEPAERRRLARALGALLRRLHEAGFRSSTASLRNVLLTASGELVFCDQPYAARLWGPVSEWARGLDLFDTFFSLARCGDWSRPERLRGLFAYTGGDREEARRLWRRMSSRSRAWFRLARQLTRLPVFHSGASGPKA